MPANLARCRFGFDTECEESESVQKSSITRTDRTDVHSSRSSLSLFDPLAHLSGRCHASLLAHGLSIAEDDEIWDALHSIASCDPWMPFRVHLQHDGSAAHLFGEFLNLRSSHAAGATPFCPEVYEYGDL